jgi:hypothetical protein
MPKATPAIRTRAGPLALLPSAREAAAPLAAAALLAWLELAGGLRLNPIEDVGRAEALFFFIWRPWILILAAVAAGHWTLRRRILLYAATLAVAAAGETILVLRLGAADPWSEMLRGLAAGIAAAAIADVTVQLLRRWRPWVGSFAALLLLGGLFFFVSGSRPYEALVIGPTAPREASGPKPPLLLMTALPMVWGEGGAFDPNSRPSETYRALEREFAVTPIDAIEPAALRGHRLMLLAQPRLLAPEELVALDEWVRSGGRVLILTDPVLAAAREFPLGDVRRPPDTGLLGPLLAHWGVRLKPVDRMGDIFFLPGRGGDRMLLVDQAARFEASGNPCRSGGPAPIARCRLERGKALLVGDADLLTDALWVAPGSPRGHERHLRLADNVLVVADWLDELAGIERERSDRVVAWADFGQSRGEALFLALLPGLATLAAAIALFLSGLARARGARPSSTNLSTGMLTENNSRTDAPPDP